MEEIPPFCLSCKVDLKSWLSSLPLRLGQTNLPPGEEGEDGVYAFNWGWVGVGGSPSTGTAPPLGTVSVFVPGLRHRKSLSSLRQKKD